MRSEVLRPLVYQRMLNTQYKLEDSGRMLRYTVGNSEGIE